MILERDAVRAILLTPSQEVLLFRIQPPDSPDCFWITPGGGLEPGETREAGLRRELQEELDLQDFVIGPLVWRRQHTFNWAEKRICQREQYHIVHVNWFEARMSDPLEGKYVDRICWWRVADLGQIKDRLTPLSLSEIVARYLANGPPNEIPAVEVLTD